MAPLSANALPIGIASQSHFAKEGSYAACRAKHKENAAGSFRTAPLGATGGADTSTTSSHELSSSRHSTLDPTHIHETGSG